MVTLENVIDWLRHRAGGLYGGEPVTQLEHALQCAALAQGEGANGELTVAALLHDIYHLADGTNDEEQPHDRKGAQMLSALFGPAVTEPVRLHVEAKRYLCAVDPQYWAGLSDMSKRSLMWQGGPFSAEQAAAFIWQPYAKEAVRLRRWDDSAKVIGKPTPSLDEFIPIMGSLRRPYEHR
jgi:phosphonate degradation associated HDIG domain protein